jgi:hypothetical protein
MAKKSEHNQVTIKLEPDDYNSLGLFAEQGDRAVAAQGRRMLRKAIEERRAAQPALPEPDPAP